MMIFDFEIVPVLVEYGQSALGFDPGADGGVGDGQDIEGGPLPDADLFEGKSK
jgi:hypothetical protein